MTTNLTMSAEAKAESDQKWAKWIATGVKRNHDRQQRVTRIAIVVAIVFAIWLTKLLLLG
jgi:tellurite resistance protein